MQNNIRCRFPMIILAVLIMAGCDEGSAVLAAAKMRELKYLDCRWEEWLATFPELIEEGSAKEEVVLKEVKAPEGC